MRTKEFARILVEDIVEAGENNPSEWLRNNGITTRNLNDKDEIWKLFVRYNINTGGVKDEIVEDHWNRISDNSILKNRQLLLNSILSLENDECYSNFSYLCPVRFKKDRGFSGIKCEDTEKFSKCPVIAITKELSWHRQHYKVAKIIVECAKRLLIEDGHGRNEGNLNDVVRGVFSKHEGNEANWRITATNEIISKFDNIKGYGRPSKVITWVLSDLGSPVHELSHWPDFDLSQLVPVDTHVQRLVVRFGFLPHYQASNENIRMALSELYPEEPRKLDLALYKLGAESYRNICRKEPDCRTCYQELPNVYLACPSSMKNKFLAEA